MSDFVQWSVDECNRKYGWQFKTRGRECPSCGKDAWRTEFGINAEYKSTYNPGEYVQFFCACGYSDGEEPC